MMLLEKIFFYLFIFCLPFQTRKIIWPKGVFLNEWNSAFFYLTDFLLLAVLFFWLLRLIKEKKFKFKISLILVFLAIALISLAYASNISIAFFRWLKLLEFILLFWYVKLNVILRPKAEESRGISTGSFGPTFVGPQDDNRAINLRNVARILVLSGLIQSAIACLQYVKQQSIGLKILGESFIGPYVAGAAKFIVGDKIVVRPYGTLPHPNVLAAFLLLAIFCLYWLYLTKKQYSIWWNLYYGLLYTGLFIGLWFSFSRIIIAAFFVFSILFFIYAFRKCQPAIRFLILIFILLAIIFTWTTWSLVLARTSISLEDQAVSLRLYYNDIAFTMIKSHPWLGIGIGNFVWQMKKILPDLIFWKYQPAHNIYLLIACEMGLVGLAIFLYFLYLVVIKKNKIFVQKTFLFLLIAFLFIGFFDHFFWTLQQGGLMFWLVSGIVASCSRVKKEKPQLN